jgi:hypothetical protein
VGIVSRREVVGIAKPAKERSRYIEEMTVLDATLENRNEYKETNGGLVASSLRRSELRERARGKGPDARVARMISDQREGRVIRPL